MHSLFGFHELAERTGGHGSAQHWFLLGTLCLVPIFFVRFLLFRHPFFAGAVLHLFLSTTNLLVALALCEARLTV